MKQTRQVRHYLRQIKKLIPADCAGKKELLKTIEQRLMDELAEHPDASVADFEADFGTPEEIADSFLEESSGSMREKKIRRKNKWIILVGCVLVMISIALVRYTYYLIDHTTVTETETLTIYKYGDAPWEE